MIAVIRNNVVINILEIRPDHTPEDVTLVEVESVDLGAVWDGVAFTRAPVVAAAAATPTLTVTEFIDLFTVPEEVAISASVDQMVKVFYGRLRDPHRQVVHLDSSLVIAGVGHCQSVDLLTAERAAAILAGRPPA